MKEEFTEDNWPSTRWPNFSFTEMKCRHTGLCFLDEVVMDRLQEVRAAYGLSMKISSGYRDSTHPIEAAKEKPGSHFTGKAVDVVCYGSNAHQILRLALSQGFTGIGVKQKGPLEGRFLHLDIISGEDNFHVGRPQVWSY
jgi:zinc D-Ala-D-Ala carboxypeptidase